MATKFSWERRIERAQQLADEVAHARQMLAFYAEILKWQRSLFSRLTASAEKDSLSGAFESDYGVMLEHFGLLLDLVSRKGSEVLAAEASELGTAKDAWRESLAAWWNGESDPAQSFFARACLQPYLELLAQRDILPFDSKINAFSVRTLEVAGPHRVCPFCGRKPQLAFLSNDPSMPGLGLVGDSAEGGRRFLMCGDCLTVWPFQRIACPNCQEADPRKLPYYSTEAFPNLRIECCDTCHYYLKSIDMTKDRRPVPPVDELAAIPLDLWAVEQGYTKIQPNLAGI